MNENIPEANQNTHITGKVQTNEIKTGPWGQRSPQPEPEPNEEGSEEHSLQAMEMILGMTCSLGMAVEMGYKNVLPLALGQQANNPNVQDIGKDAFLSGMHYALMAISVASKVANSGDRAASEVLLKGLTEDIGNRMEQLRQRNEI